MSKYRKNMALSLSEVDRVIEKLLDCVNPTLSRLEVNLDERAL